jgi:hypothetical protein
MSIGRSIFMMNMSLNPRQFIVSLSISLIFLLIVLRLIQKKHIDIEYSWLWLILGFAAPAVVLNFDAIIKVGQVLGIITPTTMIFLFAIMFLFLLNMQLMIVISKQHRHIKNIIQTLAVFEEEKKNLDRN